MRRILCTKLQYQLKVQTARNEDQLERVKPEGGALGRLKKPQAALDAKE